MPSEELKISDDLIKRGKETSSKKRTFDFEEFLQQYRYPITVFLLGLILVGFGVIYFKVGRDNKSSNIEVLEEATEAQDQGLELVVEISGAVEKPGVYKLSGGSRVEDLLIAAGGISADADREWVEKMINRAAKITDGQKILIPSKSELAPNQDYQSEVSGAKNNGDVKLYQGVQGSGYDNLVNINTSSQKELEELPGIGPVYAQSMIEHRPYSSVEELLSKDALKKSVYEKIKDLVTVY
ncbi:MAG: Competence protein ComEA helix-hairpin-helix repeat protein [Candidatus Woesebacteria bacterium GW2011_GWB1_39_12]|uniref:Competence protein ComEA helix-hairpin-helix repeat protein n=2 Tax=Candidatus Woeseibacteriota TaxID=1752722 RepID=A0A0G0MBC3_9BACT|nr:MAG: Competence protein ComEA helix-hairpin-helix repeat protein [Candidatus Woesebacteria bacterium GW2011_GWA1_39_12]KKR01182.1 MAG: Competence protein ComEA helix-hairpin-helix repeat protein [Candidatus Woesebacteria bacterium GW2011_GWB1_39_12]